MSRSAIILGGRIGYVLFYQPGHYLTHPLDILAVWHGGMSFHGGLLGVLTATLLFARNSGLAFFELTDAMAVATPIGLFFGRLANFINGELWGRVTDVPWAVIFPTAGPVTRQSSGSSATWRRRTSPTSCSISRCCAR